MVNIQIFQYLGSLKGVYLNDVEFLFNRNEIR